MCFGGGNGGVYVKDKIHGKEVITVLPFVVFLTLVPLESSFNTF
jgi:hypothetical protein